MNAAFGEGHVQKEFYICHHGLGIWQFDGDGLSLNDWFFLVRLKDAAVLDVFAFASAPAGYQAHALENDGKLLGVDDVEKSD